MRGYAQRMSESLQLGRSGVRPPLADARPGEM